MKEIIVINGCGGVGKDTFVELCSKHIEVMNFSSVDKVKEIAKLCGWDGKKDEASRKFLSDLKALTESFNSMPYNSMVEKIGEFQRSSAQLLFLHIREPEQIARMVEDFDAKTLLIKRDSVKHISTNCSDNNVHDYKYDYVIENNGTLEDLESKVTSFLQKFTLKPYYFSFGSDESFPFQGGWVEIYAANAYDARELFASIYPRKGCLNCSHLYNEDEFKKTSMYARQTRFDVCHDVVIDPKPFIEPLVKNDWVENDSMKELLLWIPTKNEFVALTQNRLTQNKGNIPADIADKGYDAYIKCVILNYAGECENYFSIKDSDRMFYRSKHPHWTNLAGAVPEALNFIYGSIPEYTPVDFI